MPIDTEKIDEDILGLLYLVSFRVKEAEGWPAWKGQDWDAMNRLFEKGFISDPQSKAKSVGLTEAGYRKAKELFTAKYGTDD